MRRGFRGLTEGKPAQAVQAGHEGGHQLVRVIRGDLASGLRLGYQLPHHVRDGAPPGPDEL